MPSYEKDWSALASVQRKKMVDKRGQDRLGVIPPAQSPWGWRRREAEAASPAGIKREQKQWDSMPMYLKDAPLKHDTSIEETVFALTGVPSMLRLAGMGVKAAGRAGTEALRSRGIGGWERVTDPGRRQFMKTTATGAAIAAGVSVTENPLVQLAKKGIEKFQSSKTQQAIRAFEDLQKQVVEGKKHYDWVKNLDYNKIPRQIKGTGTYPTIVKWFQNTSSKIEEKIADAHENLVDLAKYLPSHFLKGKEDPSTFMRYASDWANKTVGGAEKSTAFSRPLPGVHSGVTRPRLSEVDQPITNPLQQLYRKAGYIRNQVGDEVDRAFLSMDQVKYAKFFDDVGGHEGMARLEKAAAAGRGDEWSAGLKKKWEHSATLRKRAAKAAREKPRKRK